MPKLPKKVNKVDTGLAKAIAAVRVAKMVDKGSQLQNKAKSSETRQAITAVAKRHQLPVIEGSKPYWTLDKGISFSAFQLWLQCREQFRYRYIHGWRPIDKKDSALVFGSMMHDLIEHRPDPTNDVAILKIISAVWGSPSDRAVLEAKAAALYKVYHKHYDLPKENRVKAEHEFNYEYKFQFGGKKYSIILKGYIDCVLNHGKKGAIAIRETKTRTDMAIDNTSAALSADLQANSYFLACEQVLGKFPELLIYDLIKKPQHVFNSAKESLSEYHQRVLEAVKEDPSKFFHRIEYRRSPKEFDAWRQSILHPHLAAFIEWYGRLEQNGWKALEPYNPVALVGKYGLCELFELIVNGNTIGLVKKEAQDGR